MNKRTKKKREKERYIAGIEAAPLSMQEMVGYRGEGTFVEIKGQFEAIQKMIAQEIAKTGYAAYRRQSMKFIPETTWHEQATHQELHDAVEQYYEWVRRGLIKHDSVLDHYEEQADVVWNMMDVMEQKAFLEKAAETAAREMPKRVQKATQRAQRNRGKYKMEWE